jgi:hypothetical protein
LKEILAYPPAGKEYGISPNPHYIEHIIKEPSDLEKFRYFILDQKYFPKIDLNSVENKIGEEGMPMFRPHAGVDFMLMQYIGLTEAFYAYYDNPDFLKTALAFFHDFYKELLSYTLQFNITMVFECGANYSLSCGWSPTMFRELFLPLIKENVQLAKSAGVYYHYYDDGAFMDILDCLVEADFHVFSTLMPPPSYNPSDPDFAKYTNAPKVKATLGQKTVLNGYVECVKMRYGTPEEIVEQTKYAIDVFGKGGKFLLGTSDSIRDGSPMANVRAFFETGLKYGKY